MRSLLPWPCLPLLQVNCGKVGLDSGAHLGDAGEAEPASLNCGQLIRHPPLPLPQTFRGKHSLRGIDAVHKWLLELGGWAGGDHALATGLR